MLYLAYREPKQELCAALRTMFRCIEAPSAAQAKKHAKLLMKMNDIYKNDFQDVMVRQLVAGDQFFI